MDKYLKYKILVIGDSCTDVFTYGNNFRLAPEGPAPVFNPVNTKSNGGMALNVKVNIEAIGAKAVLITQNEEIFKTRYVDERTNSLLLRVDTNDKASRIDLGLIQQLKLNKFNNEHYDAIVISDYCKGFLTEDDIFEISQSNSNVFLDTKKVLGEWCRSCDFIKINHLEFDRTKHTIDKLDLYNNLIITHAHKGCEYQNKMYPVEQVTIKDMSGAGDTFISGLVCEYVSSYEIDAAIKFAQECATKVVQKKGVCTI